MPYSIKKVPAELFLTHNGIEIFHTYEDDEINQGINECWYTTDEYGSESGPAAFDVRDIKTLLEDKKIKVPDEATIEQVIKLAIDNGLIKVQKNEYSIDLWRDDLGFWVAWLSQKETNLPMVVWVTTKQIAKRLPMLLVSNTHLFKANIIESIKVSIEDEPKITPGGTLKESDFELVKEFIKINKEVLSDYWSFKIDPLDLGKRLKPIEKT